MNRHEFIDKLKAQLDDIDKEVDELQTGLDSARAEVKAEYEDKLREAREARDQAEAKLQELRDAGEEVWEDLKAEAEHTWKALRSSVNYFKSHFK